MNISASSTGTLYVVATPIGNLEDISQRAIQVLQEVDSIAAEDTRHAQKLLKHLGIDTPMQAYHDHNEQHQSEKIVQQLNAGKNIALISDAGTPLISDPGFRLTQAAHEHGIKTVPVVGACAAIAALSVAGLASDKFSFEGFLPNKSSQRIIKLEQIVTQTHTMIFYESPHRIASSLQDFAQVFGNERKACLCRELTKTFETVQQGTLQELAEFVANDLNQQKGEIVIVVAGAPAKANNADIDAQTHTLLVKLLEHLPPKKATAVVADISGIKKKILYDYVLGLK